MDAVETAAAPTASRPDGSRSMRGWLREFAASYALDIKQHPRTYFVAVLIGGLVGFGGGLFLFDVCITVGC